MVLAVVVVFGAVVVALAVVVTFDVALVFEDDAEAEVFEVDTDELWAASADVVVSAVSAVIADVTVL